MSEHNPNSTESSFLYPNSQTFFKDDIVPSVPGVYYEVLEGGLKISNPYVIKDGKKSFPSLIQLIQPKDLFFVSEIPISIDTSEYGPPLIKTLEYTVLTAFTAKQITSLRKNLQLTNSLTSQLNFQRSLTSILGLRSTEDRIMGLLNHLHLSYPELVKDGNVPGNLTHGEIASTIGVTRVTVTRLIGYLESKGKICNTYFSPVEANQYSIPTLHNNNK